MMDRRSAERAQASTPRQLRTFGIRVFSRPMNKKQGRKQTPLCKKQLIFAGISRTFTLSITDLNDSSHSSKQMSHCGLRGITKRRCQSADRPRFV